MQDRVRQANIIVVISLCLICFIFLRLRQKRLDLCGRFPIATCNSNDIRANFFQIVGCPTLALLLKDLQLV